jgi:hypothetical protein
MANKNKQKAKKQKNDEFYTQLTDIEKELHDYKEYFKGKTIFLNCDDPKESNFWKYFEMNFNHLGIKKVISTHYEDSKPSYKMEMVETSFCNGKISDYSKIETPLKQNGDFRSDEAVELLKESDIVITNPPFSLFREYIAQLVKYNKKFLVIGNKNAITYKEVFPIIKDNKVWLGVNLVNNFNTPNNELKSAPSLWFTNLKHNIRNEELDLYKKYNEDEYPKYDNYDAINIDKVVDIPMDYDGVMGVPITFMTKYNPEQFEIVGFTSGRNEFNISPIKKYKNPIQVNINGTTTNGSKANTRATIVMLTPPTNKVYYIDKSVNGYLIIMYARILIRHKR